MENHVNMDDLGVPLFQEPPYTLSIYPPMMSTNIYIYVYIYIYIPIFFPRNNPLTSFATNDVDPHGSTPMAMPGWGR